MEEAMSMTKKEFMVGTMEAVSAEMMVWRDRTWRAGEGGGGERVKS